VSSTEDARTAVDVGMDRGIHRRRDGLRRGGPDGGGERETS
jgi:hypothetical protein